MLKTAVPGASLHVAPGAVVVMADATAPTGRRGRESTRNRRSSNSTEMRGQTRAEAPKEHVKMVGKKAARRNEGNHSL